MLDLVAFLLFTLSEYIGCQANDAITASLLEEVLSLKEEIATLQQDFLELQLTTTTCSCQADESGILSNLYVFQFKLTKLKSVENINLSQCI